jgi:Protein of unknown function (DUF4232)
MSADLDQLLTALTADADRVRLAPAEQLRAVGDARTRRRFIAAASTVVAVMAILVGSGIAVAGYWPRSTPGPVPIGSAPIGPSSPAPPPSSSSPPPSSSSPPSAGTGCTASSLVYDSMRPGGAAGTAYFTFRFHNAGIVSCTVQGSPQLSYVDTGGRAVTMPADHTPGGDSVLLTPGAAVELETHETNGTGGYQPGAPECAHPATYRQVSVVLPGGPVSLRSDGTMSVQCGVITVGFWTKPLS